MSRKDNDKDRTGEMSVNGSTHKEKKKEKELLSRPSKGGGAFFKVSYNAPTVQLDDVSAVLQLDDGARREEQDAVANTARFCRGHPQQQQLVSPPPTGEVAGPEVFESVGRNALSVRFKNQHRQGASKTFLSSILLSLVQIPISFLGPMAAVTWNPIPPCGWRRMAVPDARTSSSDGAKALTRHVIDDHGPFSLFLHTPLLIKTTRAVLFMPLASSSIHTHMP